MSQPQASYLTPLNPIFLYDYFQYQHSQILLWAFHLLKLFKSSVDSSKMIEPLFALESIASIAVLAQVILDVADVYAREFVRGLQLSKWYGPSGIPLFLFGSRTIWRIQAQILGQLKDGDALAFKKSVYNECTMIAVAVRTSYEVDPSL
jgi:hypothetical protein